MGSNPIIGTIENALSQWKLVRICDFGSRERSRTKTHEKTAYSSSIRQVWLTNFRISLAMLFTSTFSEQPAGVRIADVGSSPDRIAGEYLGPFDLALPNGTSRHLTTERPLTQAEIRIVRDLLRAKSFV
jgi:hypothetical protein